jgi:hypothetical protein
MALEPSPWNFEAPGILTNPLEASSVKNKRCLCSNHYLKEVLIIIDFKQEGNVFFSCHVFNVNLFMSVIVVVVII